MVGSIVGPLRQAQIYNITSALTRDFLDEFLYIKMLHNCPLCWLEFYDFVFSRYSVVAHFSTNEIWLGENAIIKRKNLKKKDLILMHD